jgi:E3 ubiquitin-protein ligase TRIP12
MLGQFVAKALLDSRIIDVAFNPIFLKLAMGKDVPITIQTLRVGGSIA